MAKLFMICGILVVSFIQTRAAIFSTMPQKNVDFLYCAALEDGVETVKKCFVGDEYGMGARPNGVACHSVFLAGKVMSKGCWVHQEKALDECNREHCKMAEITDEMQFCCCRGDECNK